MTCNIVYAGMEPVSHAVYSMTSSTAGHTVSFTPERCQPSLHMPAPSGYIAPLAPSTRSSLLCTRNSCALVHGAPNVHYSLGLARERLVRAAEVWR